MHVALSDLLKTLPTTQHIVIAYSGGIDSHVLAHQLAALREQAISIEVVHINHGLSQHAKQWELHCADVAKTLGLAFRSITVKAQAQIGQSQEQVARSARYDAFDALIDEHSVLVTGHHQDDQAETLLLQLFRGAGPKGMAAMPVLKPFSKGYIWRPFLQVSRDALYAYAKAHQLQWIEDESNHDHKFERNFLRHDILPRLKQHWPGITSALTRSARLCANNETLLQSIARHDFNKLKTDSLSQIKHIPLIALDELRQINVLRYWFTQLSLRLPSEKKMQHILSDVIHNKRPVAMGVEWGDYICRRYKKTIYVENSCRFSTAMLNIPWHNFPEPLVLPHNLGILSAKKSEQGVKVNKNNALFVRFWQQGLRFHPVRRAHSQVLKKLFQEWETPPWQRDKVPLLFLEDTLVYVGNGNYAKQTYHSNGKDLWAFTFSKVC